MKVVLGILLAIALLGIWACCKVASDADKEMEKYESIHKRK